MKNNAIPAGNLAVVALVFFPLERLYEAAEGVLFERGDIGEDAFPPARRHRFKLFCGGVVNVDDPGHVGVGRA